MVKIAPEQSLNDVKVARSKQSKLTTHEVEVRINIIFKN